MWEFESVAFYFYYCHHQTFDRIVYEMLLPILYGKIVSFFYFPSSVEKYSLYSARRHYCTFFYVVI